MRKRALQEFAAAARLSDNPDIVRRLPGPRHVAKDCYRIACMISVLLTFGLLLLAQAEAEPEGGGLIRGVLTDATGAVLPGGFIRVFQTPSNALITRLRVEPDGAFRRGNYSRVPTSWLRGCKDLVPAVRCDSRATNDGYGQDPA